MKSLVLDQPAPTLIKEGVKTLVLVDKPTDYRGRVLIHASEELPPVDEDCYGEVGPIVWHVVIYNDGSRRLEYWAQTSNYLTGWRREDLIIDGPVTSASVVDCLPIVGGWSPVHKLKRALMWNDRAWGGGPRSGLWIVSSEDYVGRTDGYMNDQIPYEPRGAFACGQHSDPKKWALILADVRDPDPSDLELL